jgi:hypothetical protein
MLIGYSNPNGAESMESFLIVSSYATGSQTASANTRP